MQNKMLLRWNFGNLETQVKRNSEFKKINK